MGRNDKLAVALVGANASGRGWGPAAHMPAIAAVAGLELVAVCNSTSVSAAAAAETYGIPRAYDNVHELAGQSDIDLVAVAVRVPHHHSLVMPLLKAGKHVYCEWPLGATTEEAEEMASAAEATGVIAVAGLQGRHDPALTHASELVHDGWLGEVLSVSVTMIGGGALAHRASEAWMANNANGANTLTIVAGHTLDQIEYVFGNLAELTATVRVKVPRWQLADTGETVEVDAPDHILVNATLEGGGLVSYQAGSVPHNPSGWRMEAYGTKGTILATSAALPQITPILLSGAPGSDPLAPLDVPERQPDGFTMPAGPGHNIARSYARMAQAIRDGTPAQPDFRHAVRLHRLLDALRESSDAGRAFQFGS